MSAYVDYSFYTTTYLGTLIASADFPRLALRASAIIDQLTFNRAASETDLDIIDDVKMATCAVAEIVQANDATGGADAIQSESIGSNSVTYAAGAYAQKTADEKYTKAAKLYLWSTGLMFKGLTGDEN